MGQFSKPWKDLTFKDNFIFCKVMKNEEICKRMLEILLGIEIKKICYIETEKTLENYYDSRGIRLDVYVKDCNRVFDIEIQTGNYSDLLLRSRYYQSASDVENVKRRTKFRNIKETYIVFICEDDPFGMGLPVYTKKNSFAETDALTYDDKSHAVFYNSSAWSKVQDEEVRDVLRFIHESKTTSAFSRLLEENTVRAKSRPEMEDEYMYFMDVLEEEKEEAREAGLSEGIAKGEHKKALETAKELIKEGISLQTIVKCTGLPENEIKNLYD
ncbi:Rpn family recombination-promoting nuclease/putative transposase [Treponema rectale]|uniref:Putative transposase/invertase (TIGR01784 family) n=1 Tax=Treponema rectale TaxID=744512 RepID=A0A840SA61_9SPIR|nr:Rpn family recombination-promoting nuclease/putative transposase [Treponema rectale]MBB5217694.1 putative transposase/invertase (TIGR01784 family) [Treponema rectale]QOS40575.1 Rpn family recombination-promoting nuclease/putative transposase [Treponema rectale]